jgi:soluble lytic murein transglycosylase-like protein
MAAFLPLAFWAGLPLLAGEYAVLTNGFRIHADRHEIVGTSIKLYANGGVTELPASQVAAFEQEEYTAPAPATVASVAPSAIPPAGAVAGPLPLDPKHLADEAAQKNHLPEALIRSIMNAESRFQPDAVSEKGAIGLMQLMPGTAQQLHANPRDPKQNVEAGTAYLRSLLEKYEAKDDQVARAVAAYNAGPGAVDRYNGVPPYRETQTYVMRVLTEYLKSLEPKSGVLKTTGSD